MRIRSRFLMTIATAALVGGSVMGSRTSARAAVVSDEFPFPGDITYKGIPDLDTHSGFFIDAINQANQSVTSDLNPEFFVVTFPAGAATENVFVFDGNNAGLWDQKAVDVNFHLPAGNLSATADPLPNCVTHFDVYGYGDTPDFVTPVWRGESEIFPSAPQPAANHVFLNSDDSKWELFLDARDTTAGGNLSAAQRSAGLLSTGEHRYFVRVQFTTPVATAINGYKIAANGALKMTSDPSVPGSHLWLGGFIGGVVDGQRDPNVPTKVGTPYSFSRDHYPTDLKAGTAGLHLPWGPADPYVNTYAGQMDFHVMIEPGAGKTTEDYVLTDLLLENGDFDDRFDLTQPDKATGLPVPHPIGYPDSHGQPADQGGPYTGEVATDVFDSSGFALPLPPFPPGPADQGAPFVEIYAPGIVPNANGSNATLLVRDLSGNVPPSGTAGFEPIPIPISSLPAAQRVPGIWTLRFKNVDARNSVFLRSNADFVTGPCLKGRVYCDANKDGDDELGTDPGIPGVTVKITRTDVVSAPFNVLTNATGAWEAPSSLHAGTYDIEIDPTQAAIGNKPNTTPLKVTKTIGEFDCGFANYGFDCSTCECKNGRMVKKACFTADLWVGTPSPSYDLGIQYSAGCCDTKTKCCAEIVDKLVTNFTLPFSGPLVAWNGSIEVTDATLANGVMRITFCVNAVGPNSPNGWFEGKQGLSVLVSGTGSTVCDEKHGCGCITCASTQVGKGWPACAAGATNCTSPFTVVTTMVASCDDTPPPPPKDCGCVLTLGWWKTHNKYSRIAAQRIPWPGACNEDTKLCGRSWLSLLETCPRGSTWLVLAHQWIAASLNKCRGACAPEEVEQALSTGRILLEQNCGGICYGQKRTLALQLADLLDSYNNGLMGIPHCGDTTKTPPPPEECPTPTKPPPPPPTKTCTRGSGH